MNNVLVYAVHPKKISICAFLQLSLEDQQKVTGMSICAFLQLSLEEQQKVIGMSIFEIIKKIEKPTTCVQLQRCYNENCNKPLFSLENYVNMVLMVPEFNHMFMCRCEKPLLESTEDAWMYEN